MGQKENSKIKPIKKGISKICISYLKAILKGVNRALG